MNAITHRYRLETDPAHETAEEERIRHMRTCQVLIERGMHLAHEAADRAMDAMQAPPPAPSIPTSSAAALADAEARARLRQPNHGLVFVQLSRSVRQSMALQAHFRAGRPAAGPRTPNPAEPAPRPERATAQQSRPERLPRMDAVERPDWALPLLPDGKLDVEHLLETIRKDIGLATTPALAPDRVPTANAPNPGRPAAPATQGPQPAKPWRPPAGPKPSG